MLELYPVSITLYKSVCQLNKCNKFPRFLHNLVLANSNQLFRFFHHTTNVQGQERLWWAFFNNNVIPASSQHLGTELASHLESRINFGSLTMDGRGVIGIKTHISLYCRVNVSYMHVQYLNAKKSKMCQMCTAGTSLAGIEANKSLISVSCNSPKTNIYIYFCM